MKTTIKQTRTATLYMMICLFFTLGCFVFAEETKKKQLPLQGEWQEGKRSISDDCPVSAFLDGAFLFIQTTSTRSEITIKVMDGATVVSEGTILPSVLSTSISTSHLVSGVSYRLILTNQWGDCLQGDFKKE